LSVTRWTVSIVIMCTPSELVALRYKLRECYEAGEGDDDRRKEPSANKSQLFDAIWSLFRDLDAATHESATVRSEFRALKTAVFANASNGFVTQETQDCLDRPNTGWDAIHKLAAEQNPPPAPPPSAVAGTGDGGNGSGSNGSGHGFDQADANEDIFRSQTVDRTYADYKEAVRQSQAASQVATEAQAVQKRDDRLKDREQLQREKRVRYTKATGRWPTCPIMCGSKVCNGDPCAERYPDEKFDHPTVCRDKTHTVRGEVGNCLLFHFWALQQSKNSRGGTSGGYSGGYPRTGKWQGNAPKQGNAHKQGNAPKPQPHQDSKTVRDLKNKLSKAQTDLKTERLGKQPTYAQVAVPTLPPQQPLQLQQAWQPTHPAPAPAAAQHEKSDKLAEAIKMMAEQLAIIAAMQ
jgi:hypothetical protein